MVGGAWVKARLLRWCRRAYNSEQYRSSLRRSRFSSFFFSDASFLDLSARSALRLGKFPLSASIYRKATNYGWVLRDHQENQFRAEFNSGNWKEAYLVSSADISEDGESRRARAVEKISKLTESERVSIIQKISESRPIHEELASLLPWKPKKIELGNQSDSFYLLTNEKLQIERYKRELSRIRGTASFRLLELISSSSRNPVKLLALPFTVPALLGRLAREKLGHVEKNAMDLYPIGSRIGENRDSIVFFPTNGVGFGHFTRLLAVAKKIQKKNPDAEIVFFTTMPTLHILANFGFPAYHVSGRYRYKDMDPNVWNSICEEMLNMVFSLHRPKAFVFDGSFPYRGMLNAIRSQEDSMLKVWLRRGAIRPGSRNIPVDSVKHFHAVVRPGDSVDMDSEDEFDHGASLVRCNPILLMDNEDMEPRGGLRSRLGVPTEAVICYVQLGAGKINDIDSEISMVLDSLAIHSNVYVVIGESMLGDRIATKYERIRVLRDYPNSRYFNDFDFAIMAGGYNSFHEAIQASLPTICLPNMNTGRDDQLARTMVAEEAGCMVVIKDKKKYIIQAAIDRMVESDVRELMRNNFQLLQRENGADQVAEWILSQAISD
tara:strand:- start:8764 stop:10581 length:1818 start_codon:yes stop_codon:yes gene_type:complete